MQTKQIRYYLLSTYASDGGGGCENAFQMYSTNVKSMAAYACGKERGLEVDFFAYVLNE
jgi:hypothetical protein